MSDEDKWGPGESSKTAKAFDTTKLIGGESVELIWGEHPHSRSDNRMYARFPDGGIVPFAGTRLRTRIAIAESNFGRSSMSGVRIRSNIVAKIYFNDAQVYTLGGWDMTELLVRIATTLTKLHEHPIALWDSRELKKLVGRKIYYRGIPSKVIRTYLDQGAVMIEVEDGHTFPRVPGEEGDPLSCIKDDILSPHIWWFRSDPMERAAPKLDTPNEDG